MICLFAYLFIENTVNAFYFNDSSIEQSDGGSTVDFKHSKNQKQNL